MTLSRGRDLGALLYWLIVGALLGMGILALTSIGWLLIALTLFLASLGAMRSHLPVVGPIGAVLLALIVAYALFAPAFCRSGAAGGVGETETSCTSLAFLPIGGENWVPFLIFGPAMAIAAALLVRRSTSRRSSDRLAG